MTTKRSKDSLISELEKEVLDTPLTFGMAVEALRARDGLTQIAFAKKLRISPQYLCDVEKGRRLVSPEQAAKFAKAFGHPPKVLVRLSLQDSVNVSGLDFKVIIEEAA